MNIRVVLFAFILIVFSCSDSGNKKDFRVEELEKMEKEQKIKDDLYIQKVRGLIANKAQDTSVFITPEYIKYKTIQELIKEGSPFPRFNEIDSKNKSVSNTDFEKGYVFYSFWGTWCSSCIDNIVAIRDAQNDERFNKVKFVSVSVDEKKDDWAQFLYQYNMDDYMTNILIGKNRENVLSNFLFKELTMLENESVLKTKYSYVTPAYCLVKDGVILSNKPNLPKDKNHFLSQLK